MQLGHGGDVLFGVRRQAHPGEPGLPPVQRHVHIGHWTIQRPREGRGQLRHVDRVRPGQLVDVPDVGSWVAEHGGDDTGDVLHGDRRSASGAEWQRDRAVIPNRPHRHRGEQRSVQEHRRPDVHHGQAGPVQYLLRQQRLHWLAEQVLNWSGLPVVHIRPTVFLDTPLFTTMAARSIQKNGTIAMPFGTGRTSPVAVDDVARVIATVLRDPAPHIGHVYELTGPKSVDMTELAAAFTRALDRPVTYVNVPLDRWQAGLSRLGLPPHTEQHVATMAKLHRDNRYDRTADGVERVTGIPPQSIEAFVAARRDFYLG